MSRPVARALTLPAPPAVWLLLLSLIWACDRPDFEGPQLQEPPDGFVRQPDSRAARSMFAYLAEVHHDAWVQSEPPHSTIRINGYAQVLGLPEVMAARDSMQAHAADPNIEFGEVEPLTIDGRPAWGWEERIGGSARLLPWMAYRVMIPYDDVSYAVEFTTEDPAFTAGAPASLSGVVATFAIGETDYNWPLILIAIALLAFAAHTLRERSRAKAERMKSLRLVTVRKDEDEATEEELAGTGGGIGSSGGP